jgi:hypothetical protein
MARLRSLARSSASRPRITALLATAVALGVVGAAFAYFVAAGSTTASASVGAINPVTNIQAQQTGTSVNVTWSAATLSNGGAVQGYVVTRSGGLTICGGPSLDTADSCTDTGVPGGSYTYTVTAVFGGFSAAATGSSITILTAPTIRAEPANPSANTAPAFSFDGGNGSGYACQLDGGSYSPCSSPDALSGLSNGSHTLSIEATNGSSTGPATSYAWTVDASAPSITSKPSNPSANSSPSFSFSHVESAYTFKCQLDGGAFSTCTSPDSLGGLSNGSHTFQVEGVSADGATTQVASYTWTVDTTPPTNTLSLPIGLGMVWTNYNTSTIGFANLDGSSPNESFITGASGPDAIAANNSYIYWDNQGTNSIGRASVSGTGVNESFITGANSLNGIAIDGSHIYWMNQGSGSIGRANLNGTGVNQSFITGLTGNPNGLTVNASYIYWTEYNAGMIARANINGTGVNQSFITGASHPGGLAVDGSYLYWVNTGTNSIGRANLNGTSPTTNFITGANIPVNVFVTASYVYWTNFGSNSIGRANLNGTGANQSFITGAGGPFAIAFVPTSTGAYLSGSTVYFNGNASGSFSLTDTVTDAGSNPVSAMFPAISTTGWTHGAETITSGSGSAPSISYTSSAFSWTAGAGTPSAYSISSSDALGNTASAPVTFVDDTTPPSGGAFTVNSTAASPGGSSSAASSTSFAINSRTDYTDSQSGLASSTLTVQSESLTGSTCGSPGSGGPFTSATTISGTTQPSGIASGYCYLYTLTGTDNVGNTTSISTTVTIDASAPSITTEPSNPSANSAPSFSFTHIETAYTFECQLDGGGFSACLSGKSYSALSNGSHTFQVEAVDAQGNPTTAASYTWTVDNSAPTITAKPANPSSSTSPSFSFTHTESAYTFECQLDGGGFSACASPDPLGGLSNGSHTFQVEAVSADGAVTQTASYTWTVSTVPPPTNTLSLPAGASRLLWTNFGDGTIGRANLDGTSLDESLISGATEPIAIAANSTYIYWANQGSNSIGRANLDGTGVNESFITGTNQLDGLAISGSYIYWMSGSSNSIGRANLDGTDVNQDFITGLNGLPNGLAVDGSYIYWATTNGDTIARANLDGTGVNENFITGAPSPVDVAVDASHVYWTNLDADSIGRANLDGTSPDQTFITVANQPAGISVIGSFIYWVSGTNTIGRANLDGTGVIESLITEGAVSPFRIAAGVADGGGSYLSGSTLYFNGNRSGSFSLTDAATDSGSNPVSATFPDIATSGWTHGAETVTSDSGSAPTISYTSSAFSWTAGASTPSGYTVSSTDALGGTGSTPLTFVDDTTPPNGGALSVNGTAASAGGSSSTAVGTSFAIDSRSDYSDGQSGLASSSLTVQSESLAGSTCGAPGSGGPFTSPVAITGTTQPSGIAAGYCYLYTLTGTDNVGNTTSISTTVTLDASGPVVIVQATNKPPGQTGAYTFNGGAYTFIDTATGYFVQPDGSEIDPVTCNVVIPAPSVPPVLAVVPGYLLTQDPSNNEEYTSFFGTTVDGTSGEEVDAYGDLLDYVDLSQAYFVTQEGTVVSVTDGEDQLDPVTLTPVNTDVYSVEATPPEYSVGNGPSAVEQASPC